MTPQASGGAGDLYRPSGCSKKVPGRKRQKKLEAGLKDSEGT